MVKRLLVMALALTMSLTLACAQEESAFIPTDSTVLVACFSATGNTWPLAEAAAAYLNADLFRIEPEIPYTDADLNYNDSASRANREMNDESSRPALAARWRTWRSMTRWCWRSPSGGGRRRG